MLQCSVRFVFLIITLSVGSFADESIFSLNKVYLKNMFYEAETLNVELVLNQTIYAIKLTASASFFPKSLPIEYRGKNVVKNEHLNETQLSCFYQGYLNNDQMSFAAVSVCNGLEGFVSLNNKVFLIEPFQRRSKRNTLNSFNHNSHNIYKYNVRSDLRRFNVKKLLREDAHSHKRLKRSVLTEKFIETLVVIDSLMFKEFEYQKKDVEFYVLTVFNMVSRIFKHPTIGASINIVVKKIIILEDDEELKVNSNIENALDTFCDYQATMNSNFENHDLAILITQQTFDRDNDSLANNLGLAKMGGICDHESNCNIIQNTGLSMAFTIAHEIAHGLNADHVDENCMDDSIMNTEMKYSKDQINWSRCSRELILNFLDEGNGYCLENVPNLDLLETFNASIALNYTFDDQCRQTFGENSSHCDVLRFDPCDRLYCRLNKSNFCFQSVYFISDGTICSKDGKNICWTGKCLPATLVESKKPVDGGWSNWTENWSQCSHDCGIGVQFIERTCDNPIPSNGGKFCLGERVKFRTCNVHMCNVTKTNKYEIQDRLCNIYANTSSVLKLFPDTHFVYSKEQPCKLFCQSGRFYYDLMTKLPDGTRCHPNENHVCIYGKCQKVGCDLVLNSNSVEDNCGVCNGDNSTCHLIVNATSVTYTLLNGYTDLIYIPNGATQIIIINNNIHNSIAIRDLKGTYFLNGNKKISKNVQGTINDFYYDYETSGYHVEVLKIKGPTTIPLKIELFHVAFKSDIWYSYYQSNTKKQISPETDTQFPKWIVGEWSKTCDKDPCGTETREVYCNMEDESYCDITKRPADKRQCLIPKQLICKTKAIDALLLSFSQIKELFTKFVD